METELYIPSAKKIGPLLWGLLSEKQRNRDSHRDRCGNLSSSPQFVTEFYAVVCGEKYKITVNHVTNSGMCIDAGFNFGFHADAWSSLPNVTVQMANNGTNPMFTDGLGRPMSIAHAPQWSWRGKDYFETARQLATKLENAESVELVKQQEA